MVTISRQGVNINPAYNLDPHGLRTTWDKTYLGIVKNSKDAQYMGRLLVWIPELSSGPEEVEDTWIVVDYASPFGGASPLSEQTSNSVQTSYGMWFVPPDEGNQVVCMFVNGDPNRGIWLACLFQVGRHRMVPSYPGSSPSLGEVPAFGAPRGINNFGSSLTAANGFGASALSATTATPPAEAPPEAPLQRAAGTTTPAPFSEAGGPVPGVSESQTTARTANIPVIGPSSYSSHNSYSVNGIATPGGNRLVMSDQSNDTQIRIQTRNNMQLLLHNDRDMAVIMTGDGKSRIELNGNGNIDIFGEGDISFAAEGDLNLHSTNGDVNINAGKALNVRSGGETRITSVERMHLYAKGNLMQTSEGETHRASNGNMFDTSSQKIHRQSNFGIYDSVNAGDINSWAWGNIYLRATEEINSLSTGATKIRSSENSVNLRAETNINMHSTEDTNILSVRNLYIESYAQGNLKSFDKLNIQSVNGDINLNGGPRVVIGTETVINAGSVPSADAAISAEQAAEGSESLFATGALQVQVRQHLVTYAGNRLGGGFSQRLVNSVSSRVPSSEPAPNRFVACPGYSGTDTVEKSDSVAAGFKIGQIEEGQSVPLQAAGWVGQGAQITVGTANLNNFAAPITQGGGTRAPNGTLLGIPPEGRGLLDAIAAPESGGRYNIIYGGTTISDFRDHPRFAVPIKSGPNAGKTSSAAGRYQFIGSTWDSLAGKYGLTDFGPANQDRAAWYLAQQDYRARTGQDLYTDLQAGKLSQVSQALSPTWTSLSGGIEAQNSGTGATFARNYALGVAAANAGVTADNAPASPDKPQDSPVTDETPKKYIGVGYTAEGAPVYVKDPTPNWTFKQAAEFQLSDNGFLDVKNFETNKGPRPSDEPGRVFRSVCDNKNMIGYGHVLEDGATTVKIDGKDLPISEGITDEQAESLLKEDLKAIESAVKNSVSNLITQEQFDALVDFAWNIGVEKFRNSDVVKLITDKKYDSVPTEMVKWVVACGFVREELVSRRRANALRFAGIIRTEVPAVISGSPTTTGQGWGGATVKFPEYPWLLFTSGPGGIVNNPANPQGFTNTSPTILNKINQMGERLQIVLLINSGYRSDSYNLSVGGVPARGGQRTGHLATPALGADVSIRNVPGGKETLKKLADELRLKWYDYNYVGHLHVEIR